MWRQSFIPWYCSVVFYCVCWCIWKVLQLDFKGEHWNIHNLSEYIQITCTDSVGICLLGVLVSSFRQCCRFYALHVGSVCSTFGVEISKLSSFICFLLDFGQFEYWNIRLFTLVLACSSGELRLVQMWHRGFSQLWQSRTFSTARQCYFFCNNLCITVCF